MAIERVAFSDPWSAGDFHDTIAVHTPFLVAEIAGTVAGYVVAHSAADEGEILNLAVSPAARRHGVGHALVAQILAALGALGVRTVYLEVRESNAGARALYARFDFQETGRRRGYYRRPVEDAVLLRTAIPADWVDA